MRAHHSSFVLRAVTRGHVQVPEAIDLAVASIEAFYQAEHVLRQAVGEFNECERLLPASPRRRVRCQRQRQPRAHAVSGQAWVVLRTLQGPERHAQLTAALASFCVCVCVPCMSRVCARACPCLAVQCPSSLTATWARRLCAFARALFTQCARVNVHCSHNVHASTAVLLRARVDRSSTTSRAPPSPPLLHVNANTEAPVFCAGPMHQCTQRYTFGEINLGLFHMAEAGRIAVQVCGPQHPNTASYCDPPPSLSLSLSLFSFYHTHTSVSASCRSVCSLSQTVFGLSLRLFPPTIRHCARRVHVRSMKPSQAS